MYKSYIVYSIYNIQVIQKRAEQGEKDGDGITIRRESKLKAFRARAPSRFMPVAGAFKNPQG